MDNQIDIPALEKALKNVGMEPGSAPLQLTYLTLKGMVDSKAMKYKKAVHCEKFQSNTSLIYKFYKPVSKIMFVKNEID